MTADAQTLFRDGDLAGCLSVAQQDVRADSAAVRPRVFLAQLLMVLGDWDRALTQLNLLREMDASTIPMANTYAAAIGVERLRGEVFAARRSPLVFGDPEPWMAMLIQALKLLVDGHAAEATAMREQAFEQAPPVSGNLDNRPFEWLADADSRLGPMLEVILNGAYYWLPLNRIKQVELDGPEDVRDLVWLPAQITFTNKGQTVALIPTRYAGSETGSPTVQMSRLTEWRSIGGEGFAGIGQRMLTTDAEDVGLLDVRHIVFEEAAG